MTKQRAVILEVIRSEMRHLTAEEIFTLAKEKLPTISRATVYNNLHALEEEQFIRRISGEGLSDRYDKNRIPHGHLFCKACGRIYDVSIPHLEELIRENSGAELIEYELKVHGICRFCRKSEA
jgi:Fe2+ or Zn2+ uptake regulation protein